jgi:hypothetical protein
MYQPRKNAQIKNNDLFNYTCSFKSAIVDCIVVISVLAFSFSFVKILTLCSNVSDCFFNVSFSACFVNVKSRNLIHKNIYSMNQNNKFLLN